MAHLSSFWFNNSENYTSNMFSDDAGATVRRTTLNWITILSHSSQNSVVPGSFPSIRIPACLGDAESGGWRSVVGGGEPWFHHYKFLDNFNN